MRRLRRQCVVAVAVLGLGTGMAACSSSDSSVSANPPATSTPPTADASSSDPTSSPTSEPTGWETKFTAKQLAEYEAALGRWEDYEREAAPLWANPNPTPKTLSFFASYFIAEQVMQQRLEDYMNAGIVVTGAATVLWSKATRIKGKAVTIRQCVDLSTLRVKVNGKPLDPPKNALRREIDLSQPEGYPFLITQTRDAASGAKDIPCRA